MEQEFKHKKKQLFTFVRKELSRKAVKYIYFNNKISLKIRWAAGLRLAKISKRSHDRLGTFCVRTRRVKSTLRSYRFSRIVFRKLAAFGIQGIVKRGW